MDFQENQTVFVLDDGSELTQQSKEQAELDKKAANEFDLNHKSYCATLFLNQYPNSKDYEITDFINRARRSFVRGRRKNLSDQAWYERLQKHIVTFKFIAPLQRELEKLSINQQMVAAEIERAKIAKEKAQLEKQKIQFLNEQLNLVKNGSSSYYRHLTTLSQLEKAKAELESSYRKELENIRERQTQGIKNVVNGEIERVKAYYDKRFLKLSRFYELFKQKYQNLHSTNEQISVQLNAKNLELNDLKFQINQLVNEVRNRDEKLEEISNEIRNKDDEIKKIHEDQPKYIEQTVEREVRERMRAQINKLNSVLLEKEKTLLTEIEKRRNEIETVLQEKEKEYDKMVSNVSEMTGLVRVANDELNRIKKDYNVVIYTNRELNEAVKNLKDRNEQLAKEKLTIESEKEDLNKLNNILIKKYRDTDYLQNISKQINSDIQKISSRQERLRDLLRDKSPRALNTSNSVFNQINDEIDGLNSKLGLVASEMPEDDDIYENDVMPIEQFEEPRKPKVNKNQFVKKTPVINKKKAGDKVSVKPAVASKQKEDSYSSIRSKITNKSGSSKWGNKEKKRSFLVDKLINIE